MIRIVGIQRSDDPNREFVLLQNQGSRRVTLRGHGVVSEQAIESGCDAAFFPKDDVLIPPGLFVVLKTGCGQNRWGRTKDGSNVYFCHMNRLEPVWLRVRGPVHVVSTQHTFVERETYSLV
ncbi:MAG: hypothetical protein N2109_07960 [Fimbriimonadales bacterium]|nr:hypothetical protein [Fimbriimonadales bacterium]